jgi:hypothetical protein
VTIPDDPTLATLIIKCVNEFGAVEEDVEIQAKMVAAPSSSTGYAFDGTIQSATSASDGNAILTVVRSATYKVKRATSPEWTKVVIPNASSVTITSFIGAP